MPVSSKLPPASDLHKSRYNVLLQVISDRDKIPTDADEQTSLTRLGSGPSLKSPVQNSAMASKVDTSTPECSAVESLPSLSSEEITSETSPEPSKSELVVTPEITPRSQEAHHAEQAIINVQSSSIQGAILAVDKGYEEALKAGALTLIVQWSKLKKKSISQRVRLRRLLEEK
jgi:hypothetical protein